MEKIQLEFEHFLKDCSKKGLTSKQMSEILEPLLKQKRWKNRKTLAILIGILFIAILLIYNSDTISWILSAIGRLVLIQLLPYWDWTPLYNTKCLIQKEIQTPKSSSAAPALGRFETEAENCLLCETVDYIAAISNVTFSQLESTYLERGLPVIITDSHNSKNLSHLLELIRNDAPNFVNSQPCDLASNIMLKKLFNLEVALEKLRNGQVSDRWFLQLRNCEFRAVKASRVFVTRPYYYPKHLEPFYTSWLLISQNYTQKLQRLYLQGLIFVQQLSGNFDIELQPKQPCNESCAVIKIQLNAGESLVFSTDLWIFHYSSKGNNITAIATILEIYWQM